MKENLHYRPLYHKNEDKLAKSDAAELRWVLMRALQAKVPVAIHTEDGKTKTVKKYGYENAEELFCEFFMPMKEQITIVQGRQKIRQEPVVADMFFVRDTINEIRQFASLCLGFELKYLKGRKYLDPVIIKEEEMRNFISALDSNAKVRFYSSNDDALKGKLGKKVRISDNGQTFEGNIVSIRGSVRRWLRISLQDCLVAQIEIDLNSLSQNGQILELLD